MSRYAKREGLGRITYGQEVTQPGLATVSDAEVISAAESESVVVISVIFAFAFTENVGFGFLDLTILATANVAFTEDVLAIEPTPALWAVVPNHADRGQAVVLLGLGLGDTQGEFEGHVFLNGNELTVSSWATVAATGAAYTADRRINSLAGFSDPEHQRISLIIPATATSGLLEIETTSSNGTLDTQPLGLIIDNVLDLAALVTVHPGAARLTGEMQTPFQLDGGGGTSFARSPDSIAFGHILAALLTNHGERVFRSGLGVNLQAYVFEVVGFNSAFLTAQVQAQVAAVDSSITITQAQIDTSQANDGIAVINIAYTLANDSVLHTLSIDPSGARVEI